MLKSKDVIKNESERTPLTGTISFTRLDAESIEDYLTLTRSCPYQLSCYSAGFMVMWQGYFNASYARVAGCAVVRLGIKSGEKFLFPYPYEEGADIDAALAAIEKYTAKKGIPLSFHGVPRSELPRVSERYNNFSVSSNRNDSDYIYLASDMIGFAGRKFSGQRNHINKFNRLFPSAIFRPLGSDDAEMRRLDRFWERYEAGFTATQRIAELELKRAKAMLSSPVSSAGRRSCVLLDDEIIAVCCGEKFGDTMVIHIEKALGEYSGVYQFLVSNFARTYAAECQYINREDDAGSRGLRISKLQYHPIKIMDNISVNVGTELLRLTKIPTAETKNLTLGPLTEDDIPEYNRLCLDIRHNKYWGYDYREHISGEPPYDYFYRGTIDDFEKKRLVLTLAVRRRGKFIGEAVINEFDMRGSANIGLRLLPEYTGRGYGKEAFAAAADLALYQIGLSSVTAYCFRENISSRRMLSSVMKADGEDEKYYYFKKMV